MSGPVTRDGTVVEAQPQSRAAGDVEILEAREAQVGALPVRRALPRRTHRTVGSWCFADHMGPVTVTPDAGVDIAPHPHIGLQTVTWLVAGEMLHRDSLGSEQVIRPGQLNLMTAGLGVAHSEEATGRYAGELQGVQLWVAQPEATRHGEPDFEHHAELPAIDVGDATVTVLVGSLAGVTSPARRDTEHLGTDLRLRSGVAPLPVEPAHEHALLVIEGRVEVEGTTVEPGRLAYLSPGRDGIECRTDTGAHALLLGGVPFAEPIRMWWNFVARTDDEMTAARESWETGDGRFGAVASPLPLIPAPPLR
ncbi:MAG TPA: pirin family protein [Acidimicrobiia bacterium]|nr:pirin family protein [Acidimicrobiia bacterium]